MALEFVFRVAAVGHDGFVGVVTRVGDSLASPFSGIVRPGISQAGHPLFWAALLALVVYSVAAWILARMIHLVGQPRRRPVKSV